MTPKPLILGHRGSSAVAPENTLAAFSRSILDGADGTEFDVRLSSDKVPVVVHDASLKRTGLVNRQVNKLSAEELQSIDVGTWFGRNPGNDVSSQEQAAFANERLPLLKHVLELYRTSPGWLYVEMKCASREAVDLAAEVVREINEADMSERVVVESFDLSAIAEVKRIDRAVRTAALFEPKFSDPISAVRPLKLIRLAGECGADEIALHRTLANRHLVEKARQAGFEVVVWTVDDAKWIQRAVSLGIKALIANDPAPLVRARNAAL